MPRLPARIDAVALEARASMLVKRSIEADAKRNAIDLTIACLDLTTLEGKDTRAKVRGMCARGVSPAPGAPSVAAICIYPVHAREAAAALAGSGVRVASVATAFPSGQASLQQKLREVREAVDAGADEIDMVIDRAAFLEGDYGRVRDEVAAVKDACGAAILKVILEAGELGSYRAIRHACDLALDGGADFLKNATGKIVPASTPAIALVLCEALRDRARATGARLGLKLAGGIRTTGAALGYLALVNETLGPAWLRPDRLRVGASALLDDLLMQREKLATGNDGGAAYVALA
jgi:deoxyribose-phosphate aldolase